MHFVAIEFHQSYLLQLILAVQVHSLVKHLVQVLFICNSKILRIIHLHSMEPLNSVVISISKKKPPIVKEMSISSLFQGTNSIERMIFLHVFFD